ncbi:alpha-1,2-fucosyltransferase [Subdoligranulum variabile]|uniref:alpha-1,2-fucosyltransferase n=1 Tax=Subdoligranulum variabile TaxID=214851 RepID=UPI00294318B5|nr:alpha-1,2-fucosyltransferase [Subdoligranulum variabile]
MIYAELAGGLGNQMFIYAFARALGLRCGEPVTLLDRQDWRDGAPAHTVCALEALNLSPEVKILAQPGFAKTYLPRQNAAKALMIKAEQRQGLLARDWNRWERRWAPLLNLLGVHFATDGYVPVRRGPAKDFLAWGYFQGEAYFADFAPTIRAELRAKAEPAGAEADKIRGAAWPVAVHLRRGDYCKPENEILQVCTPVYYARAAAAVAQAHPDATLFVFSDDIDWAKEHLDTAGLPAVFMPRGDAVGDMNLMSLCRGFILSNSTYSWWAQYLAVPDRQVWAPDRWYAHTKQTALYQPDWQRIETK